MSLILIFLPLIILLFIYFGTVFKFINLSHNALYIKLFIFCYILILYNLVSSEHYMILQDFVKFVNFAICKFCGTKFLKNVTSLTGNGFLKICIIRQVDSLKNDFDLSYGHMIRVSIDVHINFSFGTTENDNHEYFV